LEQKPVWGRGGQGKSMQFQQWKKGASGGQGRKKTKTKKKRPGTCGEESVKPQETSKGQKKRPFAQVNGLKNRWQKGGGVGKNSRETLAEKKKQNSKSQRALQASTERPFGLTKKKNWGCARVKAKKKKSLARWREGKPERPRKTPCGGRWCFKNRGFAWVGGGKDKKRIYSQLAGSIFIRVGQGFWGGRRGAARKHIAKLTRKDEGRSKWEKGRAKGNIKDNFKVALQRNGEKINNRKVSGAHED